MMEEDAVKASELYAKDWLTDEEIKVAAEAYKHPRLAAKAMRDFIKEYDWRVDNRRLKKLGYPTGLEPEEVANDTYRDWMKWRVTEPTGEEIDAYQDGLKCAIDILAGKTFWEEGSNPVLPMSVVEYDRRYTLVELREMAKKKGLSPSGSKKELAAKLIARGVK